MTRNSRRCLTGKVEILLPRRSVSYVLWAIVMVASLGAPARARADTDVITTVVIPCTGCATKAQLQYQAEAYFTQWADQTPPGFPMGKFVRSCTIENYDNPYEPSYIQNQDCTVGIVVSENNPVSGPFLFDSHNTTSGAVTATPQNLIDTLAAMDFDNRVFARSSKLPPIALPDGAPGDESEIISQKIVDELSIVSASRDTSWWHFFTNLPDLEIESYLYFNEQTNSFVRIYTGSTITVRYPNGYTEKFKVMPVLSTIRFERVEGTLRREDGTDPTKSPDPSDTSISGAATSFNYQGSLAITLIPVIHSATRIEQRGQADVVLLPPPPSGGGTQDIVTYKH